MDNANNNAKSFLENHEAVGYVDQQTSAPGLCHAYVRDGYVMGGGMHLWGKSWEDVAEQLVTRLGNRGGPSISDVTRAFAKLPLAHMKVAAATIIMEMLIEGEGTGVNVFNQEPAASLDEAVSVCTNGNTVQLNLQVVED